MRGGRRRKEGGGERREKVRGGRSGKEGGGEKREKVRGGRRMGKQQYILSLVPGYWWMEKKEPGIHCLHMHLISHKFWEIGSYILHFTLVSIVTGGYYHQLFFLQFLSCLVRYETAFINTVVNRILRMQKKNFQL